MEIGSHGNFVLAPVHLRNGTHLRHARAFVHCGGGTDHPSNMQLQTVADAKAKAKAKDRIEREQCRRGAGRYLRLLPVAGSTANGWKRERVCSPNFCAHVRGDGMTEQDFYERCGLRPVPALEHIRRPD